MTNEEYTALEAKLRPRLTDEFLATLVEAARIDGWGNDYIEVFRFVRNVFDMAGKPMPEVAPYENFD